jgi:hypothetical protein
MKYFYVNEHPQPECCKNTTIKKVLKCSVWPFKYSIDKTGYKRLNGLGVSQVLDTTNKAHIAPSRGLHG